MRTSVCLITLAALSAGEAYASVFSGVHGVVRDPQHRPVAGAAVTLRAADSALTFSVVSDASGGFQIPSVPAGVYLLTIRNAGFTDLTQTVTVTSQSSVVLHLQLALSTVAQTIDVQGIRDAVEPDSTATTTLITREDIARTPGADRTNALQAIIDYVPGAYETHDLVHVRGGHQVSYLIDGVNIPNTNIASNVAPQIDPKDINTLVVDRGSYDASLNDRTYGVFDVVPRTGFERSRAGELVLSAGSFFETNDQLSLGDHSQRLAWFASANGNRSNFGLQPPIARPIHDAENGFGGFGTVVFNREPANQFRAVGQLRTDFYQIPKDPDQTDFENQLFDSSGLHDTQRETDSYLAMSWLHTFRPNTVAEVSPFFHFNRTAYKPGVEDRPAATTANERGVYAGMQASVSTVIVKNTISAGVYGYAQHESDVFAAVFNDGSSASFRVQPVALGGVEETFVEDHFKPAPWLTLTGGLRQTHFAAAISENAVNPRVGIAVQVPRVHWVFRAFYGHFYQPPPLTSISGAALDYAQTIGTTFVPIHGERDEEHQFGVEIPYRGWLLDADTFKTRARQYLDHNNIGESSIFIPLTVQGALVQAWEVTLRSPRLWRFGQAHLAYSNQVAKQTGAITGGLTCVGPAAADGDPCFVPPGYKALDHDQRNTLNFGFDGNLPGRVFASFNTSYGSGFKNGFQDPPSPYTAAYLPSHVTADLALGKDFGERYTASVNVLNVGNTRVLLDNSLTFGGFHYNDPRQIYAEVRYRFQF